MSRFFLSPRRPSSRLAARLTFDTLEARVVPAFLPPVSYADAGSAVEEGDFDNDTLVDLLTTGPGSTVRVRLGQGDGTFGDALASAASPLAAHTPASLAVGDFNADGKLDVVTGNRPSNGTAGGSLSLLLGRGDGTFHAPTLIALPPVNGLSQSPGSPQVADFNNDGKLDLAVTGTVTSAWAAGVGINVLLGTGQGTFVPSTTAAGHGVGSLADFNGDGRVDVLSLVTSGIGIFGYSTKVYLLNGNGDGTLQAPRLVAQFSGSLSAVAVADFDADGKLDFAAPTSVVLGNGDGTFQAPRSLPNTAGGRLASGDLNRDGIVDLVVSTPGSTMNVHLGNGDGTFALAQAFSPQGSTVVDLDRDGWADVVGTAYDSSSASTHLLVMLNDRAWDAPPPPPPPPPPPSLTIGDTAVTEGNSGNAMAVFTLTLSPASTVSVTVTYATTPGTATGGVISDYVYAADTITFAPGETTKTLSVAVIGDTFVEANETFFVNLTSSNGAIADGQAVATILNDDVASPPKLRIADVARNEGRSGTTYFTFTVTLSAPAAVPVTVNYATADGTARASNNDYVASAGSLTFAPGETSKTITVAVKGDGVREANETFFVNLGAALGALIEDGLAIGTILNDD